MRPVTPLAVENGVGKLAANLAPNRQPGKESVAHSHSPFMPPFGRKAGRGHFVLNVGSPRLNLGVRPEIPKHWFVLVVALVLKNQVKI